MKKALFIPAAMGVLTLLFSACSGSAGDLESWPEGKDPRQVGLLVSNRFVVSPHHAYRPPAPAKLIRYPEVCSWYGAMKFAEATGNDDLMNRLENRFAPLFGEESHLVPPATHVDNTVFGAAPLELYVQTGNRTYLELGLPYAEEQWTMPENASEERAAGYRELLDKGLSWQTRYWIDDMFMITLVQAQAYRVTGDRKYIDRTAREMVVYLDTIQRPNGLFYHAPNAPWFWGRGNGWMAAGMTELLRSLPADHPDRERILSAYRLMMSTLKEYQREEGLWGQLVDHPESWVETSGSAMFTYAMISGVKNGWLDAKEYGPVARKAWIALVDYIDADGNISEVCEGTNAKDDYEHYMNRKRNVGDMHGQAPVLWCAFALAE